jgi:hypothetical protein
VSAAAGSAARKLTREELARRVLELPPSKRLRALQLVEQVYARKPGEIDRPDGPVRDPEQRRRYFGDPARYFRDVLGAVLTRDQADALAFIEEHDRVLLPSGNNLGKTFLLAGYGIYRLDVVAAMPDAHAGLEQQGGRVLLPGPDHGTIFATIYSAMLKLALRAEARGFVMPGERSHNSVHWRVAPEWEVEAFSPREMLSREVQHGASGRHHRNQVALIEEGQGVAESVWKAVEGMCSGAGNKIISPFNPTEPMGPAYERAKRTSYVTRHLSSLAHPNVTERREVIPAAVDVRVIEARIRDECRDMGPADTTTPNPEEHDFVYALPPKGAPERGPRADGSLGHPDAEPRVYRPSGTFAAQVLGRWPKTSTSGLFDAVAIERAQERWKAAHDPDEPPDMVGVDPAREGKDTTGHAPRWGIGAEELLRKYAEAREFGPTLVDELRATRRQRIGAIRIAPKGDGVDTALHLLGRYPRSPWTIDDGGIGASVYDHAKRVLEADVDGVSFGGTAQPPTPGEPWAENIRTQLYVRAAILVNAGLVDVPDDPQLRQELLAHELEDRVRTVEERDDNGVMRKVRKTSKLLKSKDAVKKLIGRSPDRSDAFVLAVNGNPNPKPRPVEAW